MERRIFFGYIIVILGVFTACSSATEREQIEATKKEPFCLNEDLAQSTEIIAVEERPITEQLTLSGKITYNENDMVAFRSLIPGVVVSVDFELGDQVHQGEVLATIKSTHIQELYQQQRYQRNQIDLLTKQVQSKKELAADGLLAAPEVLAVEHELESAIIELDKVTEGLSLYKSAGKDTFHLLAPKDGHIIKKSISPGQNITEDSEALFAISNLNEVWAMVNIYASNLRYVDLGDSVRVRTVAYPDRFYSGKIDKIDKAFDEDEHVLKARVVLSNPHLELMPGLSADMIVDLQSDAENAFAIPNRAKVFSNNREYIVVYRDSSDLEIKAISTLGHNEEYTFIKEQLNPGERVIGSNALLIFEQLNK